MFAFLVLTLFLLLTLCFKALVKRSEEVVKEKEPEMWSGYQ